MASAPRPRRAQPQATHARLPGRVQAIQYTGRNAEQVVAWGAARGLHPRITTYPITKHTPYQDVLVDVLWVSSHTYAEGRLRPGDWLVMTLPAGRMEGWSRQEFADEYGALYPV